MMKRFAFFPVFTAVLGFVFPLFCAVYSLVYALRPTTAETDEKRILELWHIDGFEGGKGSRPSFLKRVAREYEKHHGGVYIMVETYTQAGAEEGLKRGRVPDLLSYACGQDGVAEHCRVLPFTFAGGEIGGKGYAYPWACGKYFLFTLSGDFSDVSAANCIVSEGGGLPFACSALSGYALSVSDQSTSAYVRFLGGEYKYLLGTQRDECRFAARGVAVQKRELTAYNDLYQYVSVLTTDEKAVGDCMGFVQTLLGDGVQAQLNEIGMYPLSCALGDFTLSAFTSSAVRRQVGKLANEANGTGEIKFLKNYLKALN